LSYQKRTAFVEKLNLFGKTSESEFMNNFQNTIKLQEPNEPIDPYPVYDPNADPNNEPAVEPDPYQPPEPLPHPEPLPGEPPTPDNPVPIPPEPIPTYPPTVTF
jgi:hypothetical protein